MTHNDKMTQKYKISVHRKNIMKMVKQMIINCLSKTLIFFKMLLVILFFGVLIKWANTSMSSQIAYKPVFD